MSGPIDATELLAGGAAVATIEVREGRVATVGALDVLRVLPTKARRTVGPWCFVDLMSPDDVDNPPPLEIGPHPHIGLSTVTWLFAGSALHSDSLGTEQLIRPGELNLMAAGDGIAHAELGIESASALETGGVIGAQMWLAQPESTRHGSSRFTHLSDLPEIDVDGSQLTLLIGTYGTERSSAPTDHPTVAIDARLSRRVNLEINEEFEHGVVPIDVPVSVDGAIVEPGSLALVPAGRSSLGLEALSGSARVMVVGGEPLGERIQMWWNFVARTKDEITAAWTDWAEGNDDRFGPVPSDLERIEAPVPPWVPQR